MTPTTRTLFAFGFSFCLGLILLALHFQFNEGLSPCPLCISQRIMVVVVGLIFLIGVIHNPKGSALKAYAIAAVIGSVMGGGISARHIWIQHLPKDEIPSCGPGLSYMFQYFPLSDTFKALLSGTGDCAQVDWMLLGLSMPTWVLFSFITLAVFSAYIVRNAGHQI